MQRPSFSIYNASAGSGKTYALVKEYLKIILVAPKLDAYRNILAITFTNKAVHEMKSRIVGNLSEFIKDDPSTKAQDLLRDLEVETNLSIRQIKAKSKQIITHIIHNYAAFDISTIDKFTHKVIRTFAHDLGLSMTFELTMDTENVLNEAVDAIIAQAGVDEILTNLLVDFVMEKTNEGKSWDISREILEIGKLIKNENNRLEITHFQDTSITQFVEIKKKLKESCDLLVNQNKILAQNALGLIESNGIDTKSFSGGYFSKHLVGIQEGKINSKNKTYHEFEDIKINKSAKDRAIIENIIPQLLDILSTVYKNFERVNFFNAFLKNITPLSLLNTLQNELHKIQEEKNVLHISEFNSIIHREIQNQPAPFIYERLGEKYRHFFIDEFQDTSEMQWQNLIPLIDHATSSEDNGQKGTLMIVGDPKQSIYRWRGGKAEQFIELSKNYNPFNNPEKNVTYLDKNYRSFSEIINFNNAFFRMMSGEFEHPDYKDLYENHSEQKCNSKEGGYVNISFLPITKSCQEEEIEELDRNDLYVLATLQTIQEVLQNGFEYKDIVILTRKRSDGVAIANYLTAQSIPIISSETLLIQNATEVHFIIFLLKYLKNSSDLDAKAHFLHYLSNKIQRKIPVHDFVAMGIALKDERDFESWLATFDVSLSFENIRKKSLYETVELIISKFLKQNDSNNDEIIHASSAYVQYFLDIVLEQDIRYQLGIADFLDYWDRNSNKLSVSSPEGRNAVRMMTIHKSKGLEFPVVIMPFADEDYTRGPKDKLWIDVCEEDLGLTKVLVDNSKAVANFGAAAQNVYFQKSQEVLLDNCNVLYVALTRAEEQLYIISKEVTQNKDGNYPNNMATYFVKYLEFMGWYEKGRLKYEFGKQQRLSEKNETESKAKIIAPLGEILNSKNIKISQRESIMWGTQQQEAVEYGNLIHEILSMVMYRTDATMVVETALDNGLITDAQKEAVINAISNIVNHPELANCFENGVLVLNERSIVQKNGKIIRPDRMVICSNNEVYLLDYKTGTHHSKHQLQLDEYQLAIEQMGYRVVKKQLVYIGETLKVLSF